MPEAQTQSRAGSRPRCRFDRKARPAPTPRGKRQPLTDEQREVAERHWPEARAVALRFAASCHRKQVDWEGAVAEAACQAARSYREGTGASYKTHLQARCVGACLDALRASEPKGYRRKGVAPRTVSLDWRYEAGTGVPTVLWEEPFIADEDPPGEAIEAAEEVVAMTRGLPPRDAEVMRRLYLDAGTTMKKAAEAVGVSEARVCQIHRESLERIRLRLTGR